MDRLVGRAFAGTSLGNPPKTRQVDEDERRKYPLMFFLLQLNAAKGVPPCLSLPSSKHAAPISSSQDENRVRVDLVNDEEGIH
jgi:hypothetical protein